MAIISNAKDNFTITVPFHGARLFVINHNGEPYTPMKPIVEGMGMNWASQFIKLKNRFSKGIAEITIPSKGGYQTMTCLALRKLAGWLNTISPNKVKPEIRNKVIQYQDECDDVLYEYWTKGEVSKKHKPKSLPQQVYVPINGRIVTHFENGVITNQMLLRDDEHIASMDTFIEMAKRANYLILDIDKKKVI